MKKALGSGVVGAGALTLVNQVAQRFLPHAPRLDLLGRRLAAKFFHKAGKRPPSKPVLFLTSLLGDMMSNSVFYSLVSAGKPKNAWKRGSLLGLAAGIGAVTLPEPLGLGKKPTARTTTTKVATVAWYVLGGLTAALAYRQLRRH